MIILWRMIDYTQILLISLIQGITEFLPISSSGHLVLLPELTNFGDQGQTLDVAAHFGTLGAVMIYVRREIWSMIKGFFTFGKADKEGLALSLMLIVASLPVIAVGLIIEIIDPAFLRLAVTVAIANLVFAGLLFKADKDFPPSREMATLGYKDALLLGMAQIFALIPGTSRSGVTMTAARARGFDRLSSARFSMLMAVPVILGAAVLKSRHFFDSANEVAIGQAALVAGLSLVTALIAIRFMMGWLAKADFKIFVYYRLALGLVLLGALSVGAI